MKKNVVKIFFIILLITFRVDIRSILNIPVEKKIIAFFFEISQPVKFFHRIELDGWQNSLANPSQHTKKEKQNLNFKLREKRNSVKNKRDSEEITQLAFKEKKKSCKIWNIKNLFQNKKKKERKFKVIHRNQLKMYRGERKKEIKIREKFSQEKDFFSVDFAEEVFRIFFVFISISSCCVEINFHFNFYFCLYWFAASLFCKSLLPFQFFASVLLLAELTTA